MGDARAVDGEGRAVARLPRGRRLVRRWPGPVVAPRMARRKGPEERRLEGPEVRPPLAARHVRDLRYVGMLPSAASVLRLCLSGASRLCRELSFGGCRGAMALVTINVCPGVTGTEL